MFDRWYVLDGQEDACRLKEGAACWSMRSLAGTDRAGTHYIGDAALEWLYDGTSGFRLEYPFKDDVPGGQARRLVMELLEKSGAFQRLMAPSVQVLLPLEADTKDEQVWKDLLYECGVRKVKFAGRLESLIAQTEGVVLYIHAGYAAVEMAVGSGGQMRRAKRISAGGRMLDEAVARAVTTQSRFLLHPEDARALRMAASDALNEGKDRMLEVNGMDRFGHMGRVRVKASSLWVCEREVLEQIVLWAAALLDGVALAQKEQMKIIVDGCLAGQAGLVQLLEQSTGLSVERRSHA